MKTEPRRIRLPLDIIAQVQAEATRERRRFANMVAVLLEEALEARSPRPASAEAESGGTEEGE